MKLGPVPQVNLTSATFHTSDTGSTQLDITPPTWAAENDALLLFISHKGADWATVPGAWTLIDRAVQGSIRGEMYWKRAAAPEIQYSITDLADSAICAIIPITNCAPTGSPIDTSAIRANAAGATGTAGLTTSTDRCLLLSCAALSDNITSRTWAAVSLQGEFVELCDVNTSTGSDTAVAVADYYLPSAGATGATSWFNSTSVDNVGMLVSILPDPAEADQYEDVALATHTNTSAANAYTIPSVDYTLTQTLENVTASSEMWFKYTPTTPDTTLLVFVGNNQGAGGVLNPRVNVYYGDDTEALTLVTGGGYTLQNYTQVWRFPIVSSSPYYIKISNGVISGTFTGVNTEYLLWVGVGTQESVAYGDVVINNSFDTKVTCVVDPDTGQVKQCFTTFPQSEVAATLSNGYSLWADAATTDTVQLFDPNLALVASVTGAVNWGATSPPYTTISGKHASKFYAASFYTDPDTFAESNYVVATVDTAGAVGTSYTLDVTSSLYAIGTNAAETILYYLRQGDTSIKRWNLSTDASIGDLALSFPVGYSFKGIEKIIILADDTLIIGAAKGGSDDLVLRFDLSDGSLLNTYTFLSTDAFHKLAYAPTDDYFWCWSYPAGTSRQAQYRRVKVSDGSVDNDFTGYESVGGTGFPNYTNFLFTSSGLTTRGSSYVEGLPSTCAFIIHQGNTVPIPTNVVALGNTRTLVYAEDLARDDFGNAVGGWYYDDYTPDAITHYGEEGDNRHALLVGGYDGTTYQMTGATDNGTSFECQVRTRADDLGDSRLRKLWGDVSLDAYTSGDSISATIGYDNNSSTSSTNTISNTSRDVELANPDSDDWVSARNLLLDLTWTSTTQDLKLYSWSPRFHEEVAPLQAFSWQTSSTGFSLPGFVYTGYLYLPHISTSNLTLTFTVDGTAQTPRTISHSSGTIKKDFIRLPVMKGKTFQLHISSEAQFRVGGKQVELLVKPWGLGGGWKKVTLFADTAPSEVAQ